MSIETTLTLLTAGGILAGALVLRTAALGLLRLGIALREWIDPGYSRRRKGAVEDALPGLPLRERLEPVLDAAGAAAIAVGEGAVRWTFAFARATRSMSAAWGRALRAISSWMAPRLAAGMHGALTKVRDGFRWTQPRAARLARESGRSLLAAWAAIATEPPRRNRPATRRPTEARRRADAEVGRAKGASGRVAGAA